MPYQTQLEFLAAALEKCHLQLLVLDPDAPADFRVDLGLRRMLGQELRYPEDFYIHFHQARDTVIYRLNDLFQCTYLFFRLPGRVGKSLAVIGPFLNRELTYERLLEESQGRGLTPAQFRRLERYYGELPVLVSESPLFAVLAAFADVMWGKDAFSMEDVERREDRGSALLFGWDEPAESGAADRDMEMLEQRYAQENELLWAVATGQSHKAELLLSGFSNLAFERRASDPVRNLKNYCIIMNTLLRKAAEIGRVHPLHLDRTSSGFARRIEAISTAEEGRGIMEEMFRTYCGLVREHAVRDYPPAVQKCLLHIQMNLSDDLSLSELARRQGVNASYLSDLFRREVGMTVTEYVTRRRMERARILLQRTRLQVQTVAQHCGIPDVNYFSKLFKRQTGKTPRKYREDAQDAAR